MVSLPYMMYSQKHPSNLSYTPTAPGWYNYPTHHPTHHANNQYLNAASTSIGSAPNGILDDSAAAASFYNAHAHAHAHMLHSSSPDWNHDNYNLAAPNSQFFNGMTPPTPLHLSPTLNTNNTANGENLQNGLQNIPPSPPITNSACSEMSSPGINSNGNGGVIGNGDASPNMASPNSSARPKTPNYGWMQKSAHLNQPNSGKTRTKDKYRVVYTDYQRLELEKEYHMSHYITIRRKSELAQSLSLSERQVKIWFQNRRAKDRKQTKKRDGPNGATSILSSNCSNIGLAHHSMANGGGLAPGGMYGLDIKPKLEPGLLPSHHSHNYGHLHQPHSHPMHHLSTMGMNLLHQSHMHHSSAAALPPPTSSPATTLHSQHLSS